MLNDQEFMRYSRQLLLAEIGEPGQQQLKQSCIMIVGLGGLGSPAALYLAAAGIGQLLLLDHDTVHLSNLQRQILFNQQDIQQNKAHQAQKKLAALNNQTAIHAFAEPLTPTLLSQLISQYSLTAILDCCDNMPTRQLINRYCVAQRIPLISGSAIGWSGQLLAVLPPYEQGCYACLYPTEDVNPGNCRTAGVVGPLVGVIGALQALAALKVALHQPLTLAQELQIFDGHHLTWTRLNRRPAPDCPVCHHYRSQSS